MLIKIWHSYLYISITFLTKLNCLFFRIWRYLRENRSWVRLCLHGNQSVSILKGWIFVCEGFWGSKTIRNLWIQWCHSNVLLQWFIGLGIRHSKRRNVVRFKNGQFCDLKIAALSSCIILFIKWPKCITLPPILPTVCYIKEYSIKEEIHLKLPLHDYESYFENNKEGAMGKCIATAFCYYCCCSHF